MFKKFTGKKIHEYWHALHTVLLFNFIEQHENGVTYYDVQQIENVPASRIYRQMKRLDSEGFLQKQKEVNEMGRPKYIFTVSEKGENQKELLVKKLQSVLKLLKSKFPKEMDFDIELFLKQGNIAMFESPLEHIRKSNLPLDKKIHLLTDMKQDHQERLKKINETLQELKKIQESKNE